MIPAEIVRVDMPWGYVLFGYPGLNEMTIVNTKDGDPPGLRFVSPDGNCGKWSFCIGDDPASAVEVVLVQGKKDERTRGRQDLKWGETTFHVKGEPKNPADPRDDGMRPVGLLLHDYVWWLGINGDAPQKPQIQLPPVSEPLPPVEPIDEWLSPESQAKRRIEIDRIRDEMLPTVLDDDRVDAYMSGRNKDLAEVHDNELERAAKSPDPCGGAHRVPL